MAKILMPKIWLEMKKSLLTFNIYYFSSDPQSGLCHSPHSDILRQPQDILRGRTQEWRVLAAVSPSEVLNS